MRGIPRLAFVLLVLAAISAGLQAQETEDIVKAIAAQAIRLDTVEAGHGFADMQPLKEVIGDARIVSLGEATHGTREFFQLKHRMLEFLATEMGFNIFSIEANMPEAYRLNDYVLYGEGDPKQLLKGMYFWTWDTQEVLDMILWMREFNKTAKRPLQFTGFDMQTPDVAIQIVDDFVARYQPEFLAEVRSASSLAKSALQQPGVPGSGFGLASASFPVPPAAGKRVRFSGYIKTSNVSRGYAGLWWRVDGKDGKVLELDNMQGRGATGTEDWRRYEIDLPVAADAARIKFGGLHAGDGTAWFDSLAVTLDGVPYVDQSEFDLDFESSTARGFYTGGQGYQVSLDNQTYHAGSQSLQMRYVYQGPAARAAWKPIVDHLERLSARPTRRRVPGREARWAAQNARVVLQSLQMLNNEVSRDESMAANIKWILDESPTAKIVLWAHNAHVKRAWKGPRAMGSFLSEMYGDQMVVFGFAFNQGSFQAVDPNVGLRNFTIGPAIPGSLDAILAATEIPIFALDMRHLPPGSVLSPWLANFHSTRSIGATFSYDWQTGYYVYVAPSEYFDSLLFVETTTAARKN